MVKKGDAALVQIRVKWSTLPADATTWEDYDVLWKRFHEAELWEEEEEAAQDGATITPSGLGSSGN